MAQRKKKENTDVALTPVQTPVVTKKELILEGDPEKQLEYATKAAASLMKRVNGKKKQVVINGKQYLEFGDWQTLGRFFGATVGTDWTQELRDTSGKIIGFEARAIVYQNGQIISSAEARCMRSESTWAKREEFAINSMAQTRASAKALRNAFGWVAELAGYASTPAEEMTYDTSPVPRNAKATSTADDEMAYYDAGEDPAPMPDVRNTMGHVVKEFICADTGEPISQAEFEYSLKFYGKPLSRAAQKNNTRIK